MKEEDRQRGDAKGAEKDDRWIKNQGKKKR
jgi:hypothetical protein